MVLFQQAEPEAFASGFSFFARYAHVLEPHALISIPFPALWPPDHCA
jgi:hypothetical protein